MYWLPYSSHTSHHPSLSPCLLWMSYVSQKPMLELCKIIQSSLKHSIRFCGIFSSLKHNSIAYRSSRESDRIFGIHQMWQSGFSRVYSNSWCSWFFEPEIIKIGLSSHMMYSNNILNFQDSTAILNAYTKKGWKLIICTSYMCVSNCMQARVRVCAWECVCVCLA